MDKMSDAGLFESLATAVIREAEPAYRFLSQLGVNADGKTVKGVVDGICFVPESDPPHLIAIHHSICLEKDLEGKWLHDPATVKPRKGKPTQPAGDLIKTIPLVVAERNKTSSLKATLILTTNKEPNEGLIRKINNAGHSAGISIDIWSRSRIAHFLDNRPTGQWLRHKYLGAVQELLSKELFHELSKSSIAIEKPADKEEYWITREIDTELSGLSNGSTFLVARSGFGKSVSCYKWVQNHVERGGFGLIISPSEISQSNSLEEAITRTLVKLHPSLSLIHMDIFSVETNLPLRLVIEDINRSNDASSIIEKLVRWGGQKEVCAKVQILCPLWPGSLALQKEMIRKSTESMTLFPKENSEREGMEAVLKRAQSSSGITLSSIEAAAISKSLGHDLLLIALHDSTRLDGTKSVIGEFIDGALKELSSENKEQTASDFFNALCVLGQNMLEKRRLDPSWNEVSAWLKDNTTLLALLSLVTHQGKILRLVGHSSEQKLLFRHDKVRDWILKKAALGQWQKSKLSDRVIADPFYAEIIGDLIVEEKASKAVIDKVSNLNPLSMFHALRIYGETENDNQDHVFENVEKWSKDAAKKPDRFRSLRWSALACLSETSSKRVPELEKFFQDLKSRNSYEACVKNGDVVGGIRLSLDFRPGIYSKRRDNLIEHALLSFSSKYSSELSSKLTSADLTIWQRQGSLRFAGFLGLPILAPAIESCWLNDSENDSFLDDYFWAFCMCGSEDPERYLKNVCNAIAGLSDGSKDNKSAILSEIQFAFRYRTPPAEVLGYLVERGKEEKLNSFMVTMLNGVDHPTAISFIAEQLGKRSRKAFESGAKPLSERVARETWRYVLSDSERKMSAETRNALLKMWQDEKGDEFVRVQAFFLWASNQRDEDPALLKEPSLCKLLEDEKFAERVRRGDEEVIDQFAKFLRSDPERWLPFARHLRGPEVTAVLDDLLFERGQTGESQNDWILPELIMNLEASDSERILIKHWNQLKITGDYVQAAIYVGTEKLLVLVKELVSTCSQPGGLFRNVSRTFGIRVGGRKPITEEQIKNLSPYFKYMDPMMDLGTLWRECNDRGWITFRREYIDGRYGWKWKEVYIHQLRLMKETGSLEWKMSHWLESLSAAAVDWPDVVELLSEYLMAEKTIHSLKQVCCALSEKGTRSDLRILKASDTMPIEQATEIMEDAKEAVMLNSLR